MIERLIVALIAIYALTLLAAQLYTIIDPAPLAALIDALR